MYADFVFDQKAETWIRLHVDAFAYFGGVPEVVVPDNLKAAVIRAAFGVDDEVALIHVKKYDRRRGRATDPDLIKMARQLAEDGLTDADAARVLNMHGTTTPGGLPWTVERVTRFRHAHQLRRRTRKPSANTMTMTEAAAYLGVSRNGLLGLERIGALARNQVMEFAPWRVGKKQLDSEGVQALVRTLKARGRLPKGGCPEGQLSLLDGQ